MRSAEEAALRRLVLDVDVLLRSAARGRRRAAASGRWCGTVLPLLSVPLMPPVLLLTVIESTLPSCTSVRNCEYVMSSPLFFDSSMGMRRAPARSPRKTQIAHFGMPELLVGRPPGPLPGPSPGRRSPLPRPLVDGGGGGAGSCDHARARGVRKDAGSTASARTPASTASARTPASQRPRCSPRRQLSSPRCDASAAGRHVLNQRWRRSRTTTARRRRGSIR